MIASHSLLYTKPEALKQKKLIEKETENCSFPISASVLIAKQKEILLRIFKVNIQFINQGFDLILKQLIISLEFYCIRQRLNGSHR